MLAEGDIVTIAGIYGKRRNPVWRWWRFWEPRFVKSDQLQQFQIIGSATA